jgi:hypothetical protein
MEIYHGGSMQLKNSRDATVSVTLVAAKLDSMRLGF